MKRLFPLYQVDSFTDVPFKGNPAAVCLIGKDEEALSSDLMTSIAAEMNLSETAFVKEISESHYSLKWFTPMVEVSLCGHATLATAHVLFRKLPDYVREITFDTLSGKLKAEKQSDGSYSIFFPTFDSVKVEHVHEKYQEMLNVVKKMIGEDETLIKSINYVPSRKRLLIHLDDNLDLKGMRSFNPDFSAVKALHDGSYFVSVTLTAKASAPYDFCSRHFSPWIGINEDPVTGSAHSYLAIYWHKLLQKTQLFAHQCSKRGGDLKLSLLSTTENNDTLRIDGKCTTILEGKLLI